MAKLIIVVVAGRRAAGRGVLLGSDGKLMLAPFRVVATASAAAAARRDNPSRDWRRPFGDTPTGSYVVAGALPPGAGEGAERALPGAPLRFAGLRLGALVLAPAGGNALEAMRAGRTRFLLHGGQPDREGRLRSTCGGLRVSDEDLAALFAAINRANAAGDPLSTVEVEETSAPAWQESPRDAVASSRRPEASPVRRKVRASFGFGAPRRGESGPQLGAVGRRAFVGLALFTFGLAAFGCAGTDGVGTGGAGGDDGGGPAGGYDGGLPDGDAGPMTNHDGGDGTGTHTTGEDTTTETTTTSTTTTTSEGPTTTTTTTTGEATTTGVPPTTDTTTTGSPPPTTDTTTTGVTDTTTTGVTDTTTTGVTDTTTTGVTDTFVRPRRLPAVRKPPRGEGSGL
jgi:hypothetical protein